jgi:capsular polysaccharide biosynthesis protein
MKPQWQLAWRSRNIVKRFLGSGPYHRESVDDLCRRYAPYEYQFGICGPERLVGRLGGFRSRAQTYDPPVLVGDFSVARHSGTRTYLDAFAAPERECVAFALPDGGIIGEEGVIYHTPTRAAVIETTAQWWTSGRYSPELATPRFPRSTHMPGTALCLRTRGGAAFYHFLFEGLSRLSVLRPWIEMCDWILVTGPRVAWKEGWLELAGIPSAKVIWTLALTHTTFDHVLFASPFLGEQQPTPEHIHRFRALFPIDSETAGSSASSVAKQFLYISRADAGTRRWQDEHAFLAEYPWIEAVTLGGVSARTQAELFSGARGIIGMHGSGLSNLAFAREPFWVVELFEAGQFAPMYGRIAGAAGGKHVGVALTGNWDRDREHIATAIARHAPVVQDIGTRPEVTLCSQH